MFYLLNVGSKYMFYLLNVGSKYMLYLLNVGSKYMFYLLNVGSKYMFYLLNGALRHMINSTHKHTRKFSISFLYLWFILNQLEHFWNNILNLFWKKSYYILCVTKFEGFCILNLSLFKIYIIVTFYWSQGYSSKLLSG